MKRGFYRELSNKEAQEFQEWARENWKVGDKVRSVWHPVIQEECAKMRMSMSERILKSMMQEPLIGTLPTKT